MERRKFFQLPAVGSAVAATVFTSEANRQTNTQNLTIGFPAVLAPRSDSAQIVWRVSSLAKGYVEFGETKGLGNVVQGDDWGMRPAGDEVIKVHIDGLKPGMTYFYRVVTETFDTKAPTIEKGDLRTFTTLDPNKETTLFSVWNDTHQHNDTIGKLAEITPAGDFLLWNGDISNDWNRNGEVAESIVTPGEIGKVDVTAKNSLVVIRGNHDLRGKLAYQVEDIIAPPSGMPWTAFRSGPVAVICLDTGEDKPDDHKHLFGRAACEPMRKKQAEWLKEAIKRPEISDAPYRLVFCHIPLRWTDETTDYGYDYFSKRSRDLWHDSLVQWGAQMVISGHTHSDTYLKPTDQFPYAQMVSGGPRMKDARLITGKATSEKLTIAMTDLDRKTIRFHALAPV